MITWGEISEQKAYQVKKNKEKRNKLMYKAIVEHGYSQKDIADYLRLYYATISRLIRTCETTSK